MLILKQFAGYTISTLLDTPYCHVLKLFEMAEMAEEIDAYTILYGNAGLHDRKVGSKLSETQSARIVQPKIEFPATNR